MESLIYTLIGLAVAGLTGIAFGRPALFDRLVVWFVSFVLLVLFALLVWARAVQVALGVIKSGLNEGHVPGVYWPSVLPPLEALEVPFGYWVGCVAGIVYAAFLWYVSRTIRERK